MTLVLAFGSAGGVLVWSFVAPQSAPTSLVGKDGPGTVRVEHESFVDAQSVKIRFDGAAAQSVTAPRTGLVTKSSCRVGKEFVAGAAPFAIDGSPVVLLATEFPLWRVISSGDRGEDVVALQKELTRLGYRVAADGRWGGESLRAWRTLLKRVGADPKVQSVDPASLAWMPEPEVVSTGCPVTMGSRVEAGAALAALPPAIAEVVIEGDTNFALTGARVLVIGTEQIDLDQDLKLPAAAKAELARLPAVQKVLGATDPQIEKVVAASMQLANPQQALLVPASAVLASPTSSCVFDASGAPVAVSVLASSVGRALLETLPTPVDSVLAEPPRNATC